VIHLDELDRPSKGRAPARVSLSRVFTHPPTTAREAVARHELAPNPLVAPTRELFPEGSPMRSVEVMDALSESFVHRRIIGGLGGLLAGGPIGAAVGFLTADTGGAAAAEAPRAPRPSFAADPCPGGFQIPGTNRCFETPIVPQVAPGTSTALVPVADVSQGIFGALSTLPAVVNSQRLMCPRGLVLGKDNRCYAKGTIPAKLRKWRPATRPPVTAADARAIRRAAATKARVKKLATSVGLHTHSGHRKATKK